MSSVISYLGRAYFHPDFEDEADGPLGVVAEFCAAESRTIVDALRTEIRTLLESAATEEALAEIWLDDGDSYYDPEGDELTMREWLQKIVDVLDEKTDEQAATAVTDPGMASDSIPDIPFKGTSGV